MGQKRASASKQFGVAAKKTKTTPNKAELKFPSKNQKKEKPKTVPIPENEELELSQEDIQFFALNKDYLADFDESIENAKKEPLKKHRYLRCILN